MQEPTNSSTPQPTSADSTKTSSTADTNTTEAVATTTTEPASSPEVIPVTVSTDVVSEPAVTITTSAPAAVVTNPRHQMLKQYGIAGLIVLIMGVALWYFLEQQGRVHTGIFDKVMALVVPEPTAVKVNGEKIPQSLYNKNYEQLSVQATSQGADLSDAATVEQIKKQSIDVLVNSVLLKQAARKAGVVVTDEQIAERYKGIVDAQGGEETLTARMAELKITKEGLMQDIADEILIQTHLDTAIDKTSITITNEEIEALYKSVTSNPEVKVPPLAEVRPQIEQEIRYGKEQELISEYIDTLKKDATIEILI